MGTTTKNVSPQFHSSALIFRLALFYISDAGIFFFQIRRSHHVIGIYLFSQSAPEKHSQEKSPQTFAHQMCLPCLIFIQSCYFDFNKQIFHILSLRDPRFALCSFDLDVLLKRAKDHRLFLILITHKLMNSIAWLVKRQQRKKRANNRKQ